MKKGFFLIVMILLLQVTAVAAFAATEYDAALKEYYRGDYQDAIIRLKAYVEKRPDAVAYYLIGYSLYKLHRFSESAEYFDQAYLIDPNFSPEKLDLGKDIPAIKAKALRKRKGRHVRAHKRHVSQKKKTAQKKALEKKAPDKKGAASVAPKTGKKGPVRK